MKAIQNNNNSKQLGKVGFLCVGQLPGASSRFHRPTLPYFYEGGENENNQTVPISAVVTQAG